VTREQVWETITEHLRTEFGKLLEVREVRRVRRVAGDSWIVTIVMNASSPILIGDLSVDDDGKPSRKIVADDIVRAVKEHLDRASFTPPPPDPMGDFSDFGGGEDELGEMFDQLAPNSLDGLEGRVDQALATSDIQALQKAREQLPRLLRDYDKQGETLYRMGLVEQKLGQQALALGYLEAGAREFADRFDMTSLEKVGATTLEILGKDAYGLSHIHALLEESRKRLAPLASLTDCRSFSGLPEALSTWLGEKTELRTLAPGETLVSEGDPSKNIFVVKSGLIGVWLEKPSGGSWMVRCCYPGWLLGESSVLVDTAPRCTASLRAERVSEVWVIPAPIAKLAMKKDPAFAERIAQTKQLHRIDSFFSMHETMSQLDIGVRDEMLACIQRLETFDEETVLLPGNEIPQVALLVARGELVLFEGEKQIGTVAADQFFGVRDSLHQIASSISAVAKPQTTVAFFDAQKLRKLTDRSPENVIAVLERLG
jgi:CRP-like cAMP-binding protein